MKGPRFTRRNPCSARFPAHSIRGGLCPLRRSTHQIPPSRHTPRTLLQPLLRLPIKKVEPAAVQYHPGLLSRAPRAVRPDGCRQHGHAWEIQKKQALTAGTLHVGHNRPDRVDVGGVPLIHLLYLQSSGFHRLISSLALDRAFRKSGPKDLSGPGVWAHGPSPGHALILQPRRGDPLFQILLPKEEDKQSRQQHHHGGRQGYPRVARRDGGEIQRQPGFRWTRSPRRWRAYRCYRRTGCPGSSPVRAFPLYSRRSRPYYTTPAASPLPSVERGQDVLQGELAGKLLHVEEGLTFLSRLDPGSRTSAQLPPPLKVTIVAKLTPSPNSGVFSRSA